MLLHVLEESLIELTVGLSSFLVKRFKVEETLACYLNSIMIINDVINILPAFGLFHNLVC